MRSTSLWALFPIFLSASFFTAFAGAAPGVHGLWVWKSPSVLGAPQGAEALRDFCKSKGINEVYISVPANNEVSENNQLAHLITLLHRSNIRVEALFSSVDADEPGKRIETSFWIESRRWCTSIRSILPIDSMAFTWM